MIARARVAVRVGPSGGTRIVGLRSAAPLLLRATPGAVYLVGGAAGPLGGDRLRLEVDVGPGAELTLRSAAAAVALRGPGDGGRVSSLEVEAHVGSGGRLRWEPEPAVAAAGCRHRVSARVALDDGSHLLWREELVAGRHGEDAGSFRSRLSVDVGGRPLLRHELRIGPDTAGWQGPAVAGGARAMGSVLVVDPAWAAAPPPSVLVAKTAAVLPLAGPGAQITALADDAGTLRRLLGAGLVALGVSPPAGVGGVAFRAQPATTAAKTG